MNVIIGFGRMNGRTVGIVANNPAHKGGSIDINSSDKEARFIRFCDAFNIPVLFLADSIGYVPSEEQEHQGLTRHAAKVMYAICEATVPKITVYIGNCGEGTELAMGTEQMGNDLILAWPSAKVGQVDAETAVNTIYEKEIAQSDNPDEVKSKRIEEFNDTFNTLFDAGARQLIQDIIDPRDTRQLIIEALDVFALKADLAPWKKHGNIPL
jgi:acetyl-CoA carboxylase carboxyltransferase component